MHRCGLCPEVGSFSKRAERMARVSRIGYCRVALSFAGTCVVESQYAGTNDVVSKTGRVPHFPLVNKKTMYHA